MTIDNLKDPLTDEEVEKITINKNGTSDEGLGSGYLRDKIVNKLDNYPELTKESALEIISKDVWKFIELPIRFRDDKEVVIAAVNPRGYKQGETGDLLKYASRELRNDKEVVLEAVRGSCMGVTKALKYASEELRNDKEVVLEAVKQGGPVIQYASEKLQNNREIALAAVQSCWWALQFFTPHFQDDIEIVRIAINHDGNDGRALGYASPRLRSNREIVLEAVKQDGAALMHASPHFDDDKEVVLTALGSAWFDEPPNSLWRNDVIQACISQRLRVDPDVDPFFRIDADLNWGYKLDRWLELRKLKKGREEDWQKKYGAVNKDCLGRWNRDIAQWKQNQKEREWQSIEKVKKDIRAMPRYAVWRQDVFTRYGRRCMACGSTENLEVDHYPQSLHSLVLRYGIQNEIQAYECTALWDVNNGAPLCKECHDKTKSSVYYHQQSKI